MTGAATATRHAFAPLARGWEWLWRGQAMAEARAKEAAGDLHVLQLQRARLCAEIGEHVLEPVGPWLSGDAASLAAALFAESIGWSLRGLSQSDAAAEAEQLQRPPSPNELAELLTRHEGRLAMLLKADAAALERLRRLLLERPFDDCSSAFDEQRASAQQLAATAQALLARTRNRRSRIDTLSWQRVWRGLALAGVLAAVACLVLATRDWRERRADRAAGSAWLASSIYSKGCQSPDRHCQPEAGFFFHTNEENRPWLELDLGREQRVRGVRVINRTDCCHERAVPLVVEVSSDHREWREVIRRNQTFKTWRAHFQPTTARWVRFRADRRTYLHLRDVRVLD